MKKQKTKTYTFALPSCEHKQIQVTLEGRKTDGNRPAEIVFPSDAMDIKLYFMESDLRILAYTLLELTNEDLDDDI